MDGNGWVCGWVVGGPMGGGDDGGDGIAIGRIHKREQNGGEKGDVRYRRGC